MSNQGSKCVTKNHWDLTILCRISFADSHAYMRHNTYRIWLPHLRYDHSYWHSIHYVRSPQCSPHIPHSPRHPAISALNLHQTPLLPGPRLRQSLSCDIWPPQHARSNHRRKQFPNDLRGGPQHGPRRACRHQRGGLCGEEITATFREN